jgi:hypothetical protein
MSGFGKMAEVAKGHPEPYTTEWLNDYCAFLAVDHQEKIKEMAGPLDSDEERDMAFPPKRRAIEVGQSRKPRKLSKWNVFFGDCNRGVTPPSGKRFGIHEITAAYRNLDEDQIKGLEARTQYINTLRQV